MHSLALCDFVATMKAYEGINGRGRGNLRIANARTLGICHTNAGEAAFRYGDRGAESRVSW